MNKLTLEHRIYLLKTYWKNEQLATVLSLWEEDYDESPPSCSAIYDLIKKFYDTCTVAYELKNGTPISVRSNKTSELVVISLIHSPFDIRDENQKVLEFQEVLFQGFILYLILI
jgi:hypothetical protein